MIIVEEKRTNTKEKTFTILGKKKWNNEKKILFSIKNLLHNYPIETGLTNLILQLLDYTNVNL